jgi:hypothetical protein
MFSRFCLAFAVCVFILPGFICAQTKKPTETGELKDFTKPKTEHMIVEIGEPIEVRSIRGVIFYGANDPVSGSLFELSDASGKIRSAKADKAGHFHIRGVAHGTYDFKATKDGFQSVIGKIVVSNRAQKANWIQIQMSLGV